MNSITNTTNMTIRIDKDFKKKVDVLFNNLGTNTTSAIMMFLKQCEREQSLVFTPTLAPAPSKELAESLKEIEDYKKGKTHLDSYNSVSEMFEALDNE